MSATAESLERTAAAEPSSSSAPQALSALGRRWTYAQLVAEMPETNQPTELWNGELIMSPSPSFFHQKAAFRFQSLLNEWVTARQLGEVIGAPIDMVLSPHRVTQPDVAFIAKERLGIIERVIMGPVDLAAEVVSLTSHARDRIEKKDLYEQYGVKEYWIIDPEAETVDVLFLESSKYVLVMRCRPGQTASSRLLPGFEVPVGAVLGHQ